MLNIYLYSNLPVLTSKSESIKARLFLTRASDIFNVQIPNKNFDCHLMIACFVPTK